MSQLFRQSYDKKTGQKEVSLQRRLPVRDIANRTASIVTETAALYYFNSGVLTADAGQAAGTIVVGSVRKKGQILNSTRNMVGQYGDSSVTISGALATERPFRGMSAEGAEAGGDNSTLSLSQKATLLTEGFRNGDYCVDYETGMFFGLKANANLTVPVTYSFFVNGVPLDSQMVTSDTQIKNQIGLLGFITLSCADSAPTAGTIDVYDNPAATGTKIFSTAITTTYFAPITIPFNRELTNGLYIDFTTTADVNVTVGYL